MSPFIRWLLNQDGVITARGEFTGKAFALVNEMTTDREFDHFWVLRKMSRLPICGSLPTSSRATARSVT
jgi:hypothetical protein